MSQLVLRLYARGRHSLTHADPADAWSALQPDTLSSSYEAIKSAAEVDWGTKLGPQPQWLSFLHGVKCVPIRVRGCAIPCEKHVLPLHRECCASGYRHGPVGICSRVANSHQ